MPGPRRRPGRHQRAELGGAPVQRPARYRAGRGRVAAGDPGTAGLGQRGAQRRPGPDAQFRAQPVGHLAPGDQRPGPVAGRGQLPDQVSMCRFVQRIQLAAQPGPVRRHGGVAVALGGGGQGGQRLRQLRSLLPPCGLRPVLSVSGQQLAVTQRCRRGGVASGGPAPAVGDVDRDRFRTQPDRGPGHDQRAVADRLAQRPHCGAQVRPRGRPSGAGPQERRHGLAVTRPRAHGKKSEQPASRQGERDLLAVSFGRHPPKQPHLQHALTVDATLAFVPR